jgi:hypothetical protein
MVYSLETVEAIKDKLCYKHRNNEPRGEESAVIQMAV